MIINNKMPILKIGSCLNLVDIIVFKKRKMLKKPINSNRILKRIN